MDLKEPLVLGSPALEDPKMYLWEKRLSSETWFQEEVLDCSLLGTEWVGLLVLD